MKNNKRQLLFKKDVKAWAIMTGVSLVLIVVGIFFGRMISFSNTMQMNKIISEINGRNRQLLDETYNASLELDLLPSELKKRTKEIEQRLESNATLREDYREQGKRKSDIRALYKADRTMKAELDNLKIDVLKSIVSSGSREYPSGLAGEYMWNKQDLEGIKGPSDSSNHSFFVVLFTMAGMVFLAITWLGVFGFVFVGILGGLNLLWEYKYIPD